MKGLLALLRRARGEKPGFLFQLGAPPIPLLGTKVVSKTHPWFGVGEVILRDEQRAIRWPGGFLTTRLDPESLKELALEEA